MCIALVSIACGSARSLKTSDGSEVNVVCPPSVKDIDPSQLATVDANRGFLTPGALSTLLPPEAPNSLGVVIPRASPTGPINCCDEENNRDFGARFGGGFASEEQLIQMGRLCGVRARGGMSMRVDLYAATPGAAEAYRREAETMKPGRLREGVPRQDEQLLSSIGDQRVLTRILEIVNDQKVDSDTYELLFRRRNVIARIELSYGFFPNPGKGPPDPLLEYASQLDRNIEAAAQQ